MAGHYSSFDAGRGCPFQCSFCTIINVQGRKSRYRTADDVEQIVRANAAQDITRFFVTDDNFARNRNWEPILDRLIELRERERLPDPPAAAGRHAVPPHSGLHREGGARRLHRGVHRAREHQSRIPDGHQEAPEQDLGIPRDAAGVAARPRSMTYAGYILGFPTDTPESIARDIEIIKTRAADRHPRVLLPDAAAGLGGPQEAPLSGVADGPRHEQIRPRARLHGASAHVARRSGSRPTRDAWARYYSDDHVETIMRRAAATGIRMTQGLRRAAPSSPARPGSRACIRCSSASSGARSAPSAATACRSSIRWSSIRGGRSTSRGPSGNGCRLVRRYRAIMRAREGRSARRSTTSTRR